MPWDVSISLRYYLKDHTAIIELAEACGLKHLKREEYDILNTNTAGFGVLINHAISQGANNLILCVGGSASVDGGIGALREMGLTIVNNSPNRNYITDIKGINTELLQQKFKKFILQYCVMSIILFVVRRVLPLCLLHKKEHRQSKLSCLTTNYVFGVIY